MANEEHLEILKKGTKAWNNWRECYRDIKPDLSGVNLEKADLSETNLNQVDLRGANLSQAILQGANLRRANLSSARHSERNPQDIEITKNNFIFIFLEDSSIDRPVAYFRKTNLSGCNLSGANLEEANLNEANLSRADLSQANLSRISALRTNFSQAILTGACLEDWHTNTSTNLEQVMCDYVYLKFSSYPIHSERRPHNGDFVLGEFTKLFQKSKEIVDLIFRDGISWDAFACVYKRLRIENEDLHLDIKTVDNRDGVLVVTVQGIPETYQAKWKKIFLQRYELVLKTLETRYQGELKAKHGQIVLYERMISQNEKTITQYNKTIDQLLDRLDNSVLRDINMYGSQHISSAIGQTALSEVSKYNLSIDKHMTDNRRAINTGGGNYNERIDGNYVQGNYYAAAQQKSIVEAASEIQQLLEQLDKSYPIDTTTGKMALATEAMSRIESNPSLAERIVSALQAGSIEAIAQLLNHPASSFVIGALEDWKKNKES